MADLTNPIDQLASSQKPLSSVFSPLREPIFRSLWIAAVISYTGTWVQNVGTGWYMTSLTTSATMVGLVQVAMSLPVFLVALPAGALADIVDRRRLLLITQWWMVVAAAALGLLTILGMVTPWLLLAFTFLLGVGAVMNDPAWQAITPEIVSSEGFASAVALNSAGFNMARAVGPAIGGIVIAAAGAAFAFLLNAISFLGVILFLHRWKNVSHTPNVPAIKFRNSLADGIRQMRTSPAARAVLVRTGLFSIFASVLWALLPLVARPHGSIGYGILLGCFGFGALTGASMLHPCRQRFSVNSVFAAATILYAVAVLALPAVGNLPLLCAVLFCAGIGWITILASLNFSAQTMAPKGVRARALSMYLLVLQGGMAAGSAIWGALADRVGLEKTFFVAAAGLLAGLITIARYGLEVRPLEPVKSVSI